MNSPSRTSRLRSLTASNPSGNRFHTFWNVISAIGVSDSPRSWSSFDVVATRRSPWRRLRSAPARTALTAGASTAARAGRGEDRAVHRALGDRARRDLRRGGRDQHGQDRHRLAGGDQRPEEQAVVGAVADVGRVAAEAVAEMLDRGAVAAAREARAPRRRARPRRARSARRPRRAGGRCRRRSARPRGSGRGGRRRGGAGRGSARTRCRPRRPPRASADRPAPGRSRSA